MKPLQIVLLITVIAIAASLFGFIIWSVQTTEHENNRVKDYSLEVSYLNGKKDTISIKGYVHYPPYLSDGCIRTGLGGAARCYVIGFKFIEK